MAHPQQLDFLATVARYFPGYFVGSRVLEVGSLDVNGSARILFTGGSYTGLDIAPGPGVDVVCGGHEYGGPDGVFDVVLSAEVMEHNPYWVETARNMFRVCRPGGLVLVTCATTGRPEHGTSRRDPCASPLTVEVGWDYYRNVSARGLREVVSQTDPGSLVGFWVNWSCHDLYMAGIKAPPDPGVSDQFAAMGRAIEATVARDNRAIRAVVKRTILGVPHGEAALTAVRRLRRRGA